LGAGAPAPTRERLGLWLDFAARASAITCTRKGSNPPTLPEVEAAH
jgi:fructokinase